jgi:ketosteroid isomerase-like protein
MDQQEIIDVTITYAWALDTKHLDQLRNVFTPDATAVLRGVECNGVEAIIERIGPAIMRLDATQHFIGNHQVAIDGDTATCRCQLQSQHVKADVEGGDTYLIGGTYDDRLVRTADGWRITRRIMAQTWTTGNPAVTKR